VWCVELAAAFWKAAGPPPPFPRDLTGPAVWFGLSVESVPELTVARTVEWFRARHIPLRLDERDRQLRGCLVAAHGEGFVLLDADDDPGEQRFTLSHELGHYLRDYWRPRQLVRARLGPHALDVLDGSRPPTPDERVRAVLRHAPVGPFAHLLARDDDGTPVTAAEREAEAAADRLAFELLAPAAEVGDAPAAAELASRFGLPPGPAARYAALLRPDPPSADPALARLLTGLKPQ
jgi:hypothetical protein